MEVNGIMAYPINIEVFIRNMPWVEGLSPSGGARLNMEVTFTWFKL